MKSVLIIEDDAVVRQMYKEMFKAKNWQVYEAEDGQSGVDLALTRGPDAVILDLLLPRQGGIRTLRIMRSLPKLKHIPIVILTAQTSKSYKSDCMPLAQGYFMKTEITPAQIVAKLNQLVAD